MTDACRQCRAPIRLVRTELGMMTQIDTSPADAGDWVIDTKQHGEQLVEYVRRHWPLIDSDKHRYTKHECKGAA